MRSYAVRLDCLLLLRNGSIWVMSMAAKDVHAKVFKVSYECGLGDRCRPAGTAQKRRRWLGFMGSAQGHFNANATHRGDSAAGRKCNLAVSTLLGSAQVGASCVATNLRWLGDVQLSKLMVVSRVFVQCVCCLGAMNPYGSEGPTLDLHERPRCAPRGYDNTLFGNWGGGSCWINAALQFVYSAERIRENLWTHGCTRSQEDLGIGVGTLKDVIEIVQKGSALEKIRRCRRRQLDDDAVSFTFCATLTTLDVTAGSEEHARPAFWYPSAALASDYV